MLQVCEQVRLDRFLFSIRYFKSRSQAAEAVDGGKVKVNGDRAKPNKWVRPGDKIQLKRHGEAQELTVIYPIEKRVGAKDAVTCYSLEVDPGLDDAAKAQLKMIRELAAQAPKTRGKPSKRDRRKLEEMKRGW